MAWSEAEQASLDQIDRSGFHLNEGRPCECGEDADYSTRKKVGYSDFVTYYHTCATCGNEFSTYIEG